MKPPSGLALRRLAWGVWGFQALVMLVQATLTVVAPPSTQDASWGSSGRAVDLLSQVIFFLFPTIGLLVVLRQPHHRIGWLLLAVIGLGTSIPNLLDCYSTYALVVAPGTLPGAAVTSALTEGSWVWPIGTMGILLILLFPDGRLPTPRWRWLLWLGGACLVLLPPAITLSSPTLTQSPVPHLANPLVVHPLVAPLNAVGGLVLALLPICIISSAVALVLRFRRSHGTERMQLKWLTGAGAVVAATYLAAMGGNIFISDPFGDVLPTWLQLVQDVATAFFGLIPIAIGVAILRHRLYDIDVVIKRTVVYGTLTVLLAAVYFVVVLTLRSLTDSVAGQSDLAVAASTLVVAGLFRPLRRRIQTVVDRRFYRRSYDAVHTIDSFSERLQQEVDLEAVTSDLRQVVAQTMQPTQVSLWLRASEAR
ncbi:MAG: hypothetical protein JOZ82_01800 [Marmoricola sp.]|nr:hypothetical protein [Marmoricola sp.]